jgi:hypothetical protein
VGGAEGRNWRRRPEQALSAVAPWHRMAPFGV